MVHEVQHWDSDSDWVDDEEKDGLDQDPLMDIQDRVRPAGFTRLWILPLLNEKYEIFVTLRITFE